MTTLLHEMETFESAALTETYWSVESNKKAIVSDEFRLRQGYRKVTGLLFSREKRHLVTKKLTELN